MRTWERRNSRKSSNFFQGSTHYSSESIPSRISERLRSFGPAEKRRDLRMTARICVCGGESARCRREVFLRTWQIGFVAACSRIDNGGPGASSCLLRCAVSAPRRVQFTEELPARVHALPRLAAPQLPTFLRGTTGFVNRDVDAVGRATLAGLQADEFGGAAGRFWLCQSDSDFGAGVRRRLRRGPLQPASGRDLDASGVDDPGFPARGPD